MFCQKCGAPASDQTKFCKQCGHKLKKAQIPNTAIVLAAIAAVFSVGTSLLGFLPRSDPAKTETTPTLVMAATSPSVAPLLRISPTPKPTQRPREMPEPTPDYPYRHTPTLEYPSDGDLFSYRYSSGKIVFRWRPIAGSKADRYKIEVEYGSPSHYPPWRLRESETPWNYCTVELTDAQTAELAGRWRVTPIFADGRSGVSTEWWTFRFTR